MKKNFIPSGFKKIALAVSGGSDSMALTILAKQWAKKNNIDIIAFTIDHKLRTGSAMEAKFVENYMNKNNIFHKTLIWEGKKPKTGIQQKARTERYKLLVDAINEHGTNYVLLGHHKDDEIETFIMRLEKKSGLGGLSCMAPKNILLTDSGPINILRPFLEYDKNHLIHLCNEYKTQWVEDPSNKNIIFKRAKIRSLDNNSIKNDFYKTILVYKKLKNSINILLKNFISEYTDFSDLGVCRFSRNQFIKSPIFIQELFLKKIFFSIGGRIYPPKSRVIRRIIKNISCENCKNFNAGKVFFDIKKKIITVLRQPESNLNRITLSKGNTLWDRRFLVINKSNKSSISVGYLGYKDYLNLVKLKKIVKSDIHCYAVNTLPTIRSLDEIVYIPHLNYSEDKYWEKKIKVKYLYDEYLNLKDNFNQE